MRQQVNQKLHNSKLKVEEHLKSVLAGSLGHYQVSPVSEDLSLDKYLDHMVEHCMLNYDKAQGVSWYIKDDSLIRDARQQGEDLDHEEVDAWAWTGQFYNSCRAALLSLEFHGKNNDDNISQLKEMLDANISDISQASIRTKGDLKRFNGLLITLVSNITGLPIKQVAREIDIGLDCAGLRDKHHHVSTIMKGPDGSSMMVSDVKLDGINDEAKKVIEGAASKKWKKGTYEDFIKIKSCAMMVKNKYNQVVPTQFSRVMPGLRNAYMETVYVLPKGKKDLQTVVSNYRSASPAFLGGSQNDMFEKTKIAIETFSEQIGGEPVCLNSLMTFANISRLKENDEIGAYYLFKQVKQDKKGKIYSADTPVNAVRWLSASPFAERDLEGFKIILQRAASFTKENKSEEQLAALDNIEKSKELMKRGDWYRKDVHYELSARMHQAVHDLKRGCLCVTELPDIDDEFAYTEFYKVLNSVARNEGQRIDRNDYEKKAALDLSTFLTNKSTDFAKAIDYMSALKEDPILRDEVNALLSIKDIGERLKRRHENPMSDPDKMRRFKDILEKIGPISKKGKDNKQIRVIEKIEECRNKVNSNTYSYSDALYKDMRTIVAEVTKEGGVLVDELKVPEIISFCKSGKDRTGIDFQISADMALSSYYKGKGNDDIREISINSGHQQFLAGVNGGTPLCYGIKGEGSPSMPKEYRKKQLSRETSKGNVLQWKIGEYETSESEELDYDKNYIDESLFSDAAEQKPVQYLDNAYEPKLNSSVVQNQVNEYGDQSEYGVDQQPMPSYNPNNKESKPSLKGFAIGVMGAILMATFFGGIGLLIAAIVAIAVYGGNNNNTGQAYRSQPPRRIKQPIYHDGPQYDLVKSSNHAKVLGREDKSNGSGIKRM